jgi:hypothetical protein
VKLDPFEKRRGGPFVYVPPEEYPTYIAKLILGRLEIDPDTVVGRLNDFLDQCDQRLALYKFDQLPPLAAQFETDLRAVKVARSRPNEAQGIAARESVHRRAGAFGWIAAEIDRLLEIAGVPSAITKITWRGATVNGREIDRAELRQSLRTCVYDDANWEKRVGEMPPIQAPSEEPR